MAIKSGDAVQLNPTSISSHFFDLRRFFPDDDDWNFISSLPSTVGLVVRVRTREMSFPTIARGVEEVRVVQTAEVVWPSGRVNNCPVEFLNRV